jgi:hypothetical protein
MEKYENIIKIEEIRKLVEDNQYIKALKILETMDIHKIKSLTDLSILADVLTQNERYDVAMELLTRIYAKTKTRRVLYQLVDLSIKCGKVEEAEDYLERYIKVAPQDSYRYIFRYCIDKLSGEANEVLIASLEQLKEYEYIEMWAYELAKLYHKSGMKDKCVRECSDIILWFGDGIYVEKAKLLKGYYVGDINPITMLKAKEKKEAEKKLGLDKTKDYSTIRSQIDQFLAEDETKKQNECGDEPSLEAEVTITEARIESEKEEEELIQIWNQHEPGEDSCEWESEEQEEPQEICKNQEQEEPQDTYNNKEQEEPQDNLEQEEPQDNLEQEKSPETYNSQDQEHFLGQYMKPEQDNEKVQDKNNKFKQEAYQDEKDIKLKNDDTNVVETNNRDDSDRGQIHYMEECEQTSKFTQLFLDAGLNYETSFGFFNHMKNCRKQIEVCLEQILTDHKKENHIFITGERKSGKTTLAKYITKVLFDIGLIKSSRVAIISAEKLNIINLSEKKDKLINSTLIIENAGQLETATVSDLIDFMWELKGNVRVFLEGDQASIESLLLRNLELTEVFHNSIHLPNYTMEELYGFANYYIEENEYHLSQEAKITMWDCVQEIYNNKPMEEHLKIVMEAAVYVKKAADDRNKKALTGAVTTKDLNSDEFLQILGTDFN